MDPARSGTGSCLRGEAFSTRASRRLTNVCARAAISAIGRPDAGQVRPAALRSSRPSRSCLDRPAFGTMGILAAAGRSRRATWRMPWSTARGPDARVNCGDRETEVPAGADGRHVSLSAAKLSVLREDWRQAPRFTGRLIEGQPSTCPLTRRLPTEATTVASRGVQSFLLCR